MTEASGVGWVGGVVRCAVSGGAMPAEPGPIVTPQPSWVGVVANPSSGRGAGRRDVVGLIEELGRRHLTTRVAWTLDERADLVAEASCDPCCRCLVAAGGDGTVAALVNERPTVPITVLPTGTE